MEALIAYLESGQDLSSIQIRDAATMLIDESFDDTVKAKFLKTLAAKGEKAEEVAEFVKIFLEYAVDPEIDTNRLPGPMIDVCGTGGDRLGLFNISTATMFVTAASGGVVVKHGNRGVTSRCGGADVLEALGVPISLSKEKTRENLERNGVGFFFAPLYHPTFKGVRAARRILAKEGITSIFNMLGPLLNPARPPFQLVGVFTQRLLKIFPRVFEILKRERVWTVHGSSPAGPLDELSTLGSNRVIIYEQGQTTAHIIEPASLGLDRPVLSDLTGGSPEDNAKWIYGILDGSVQGAKKDIVLLNAGAALVICNLASNLAEGIAIADENIRNGNALRKLKAIAQS